MARIISTEREESSQNRRSGMTGLWSLLGEGERYQETRWKILN